MTLADRVNDLAKRDPEAAALIRDYERKLAEDLTCLQRSHNRLLARVQELEEQATRSQPIDFDHPAS